MKTPSISLSYASACIALAISSTAVANDFSQTIFFGDSLTDSGYFKDTALIKLVSPNTDAKFTTNPDLVWSEHLAKAYGSNATSIGLDENGNNYAGGGAKVTKPVNNFGLIPLSFEEQIDKYLAERSIDSSALYATWIGANDIFAANNLAKTDPTGANKAIIDAATNASNNIKRLHANGANNILLFNLPDIGLTPKALSGGKESEALYTQQSQLYNNTLMSSLSDTNANIIALDTFSLLQEVVTNPSTYGYKNVTDKACDPAKTTFGQSIFCLPTSLAENNANNTYVFADDVHPTGITHKSIAKYAQSVIEAPKQIAQTSINMHEASFSNNDVIQNHLNLVNDEIGLQDDAINLWGNVNVNTPQNNRTEGNNHSLITVGLEKNGIISQNSTTGIYVQHGQYNTNLTNTALDTKNEIDSASMGLGLYHKQQFNNGINLGINLGFNKLDTNSVRKIELSNVVRTHKADGDGSQLIASARLGKSFDFNEATLTPFAQLTTSTTKINNLLENGEKSTAMNYGKQDYNDTNAKIGVTANFKMTDNLSVFGQTAYSARVSDDDTRSIKARVNNLDVNYFNTPVTNQNSTTDGVDAIIGLKGDLVGLTAAAGITYSNIDSKGTGAFLEINKQF